MRGLRLFVRPLEAADHPEVIAFLERQGMRSPAPACGLLGKLLGDLVALVSLEVLDDAVRVDNIIVASDLRRKWIGRVMLREVETLAAKLDRPRIVIEDARDAEEFLRRTGFARDGEGEQWFKAVP